jgi:hypothetical protein
MIKSIVSCRHCIVSISAWDITMGKTGGMMKVVTRFCRSYIFIGIGTPTYQKLTQPSAAS